MFSSVGGGKSKPPWLVSWSFNSSNKFKSQLCLLGTLQSHASYLTSPCFSSRFSEIVLPLHGLIVNIKEITSNS